MHGCCRLAPRCSRFSVCFQKNNEVTGVNRSHELFRIVYFRREGGVVVALNKVLLRSGRRNYTLEMSTGAYDTFLFRVSWVLV